MDTYTIEDLVASAVAQRPGDFEEIFHDLVLDRAADAVNARKQELAKTIFNNKEEVEDEEKEIKEPPVEEDE